MKGDFSRDTFDSKKHYARVLMQQGRVQLDADWNEQQAIVLHHLRMLTVDLIGEHWAAGDGFKLKNDSQANDFLIGDGRFYANGILCENESPLTYTNQIGVAKLHGNKAYLAYLDVWERHITSIEDDSIREVALGGADSCTRAKVVWQVKALPLTDHEREKLSGLDEKLSKQLSKLCETLLSKVARSKEPSLAARIDPGQQIEDAQVTPPASKYRGAENQLYRVEIHSGGPADDATFKWSRNNGSIGTAWIDSAGNDLKVRNTRGFVAGNWAELTDDNSDLLGKPGALVHIVKVEDDVLSIDPAETLPARSKFPVNPKIRRWDQLASDAADQERKKLARDIHDSVIQPYVGLQLGLAAVRQRLLAENSATLGTVTELCEVTNNEVRSLRNYLDQLKAAEVQDGVLLPAVRRFAANYTTLTGIRVQIKGDQNLHLNDRLAAEVFQMISEALSNIRRHTSAQQATVDIACDSTDLILKVANENIDRVPKLSFRPKSIAERVAALGGHTAIYLDDEKRTVVAIQIPL